MRVQKSATLAQTFDHSLHIHATSWFAASIGSSNYEPSSRIISVVNFYIATMLSLLRYFSVPSVFMDSGSDHVLGACIHSKTRFLIIGVSEGDTEYRLLEITWKL